MSIKNDPLYEMYIFYLESRKMNTGAYNLSSISNSKFEEFKYRYSNSPEFKKKYDNLLISNIRDQKIENILEKESIYDADTNIALDDDFFNF